MKTTAICFSGMILLLAMGSPAQTTTSIISLTNFVANGSKYVATTNIAIASGTMVRVTGDFLTANIGMSTTVNPTTSMSVQYSGGSVAYPSGANYLWANQPIPGPCTLTLTAVASNTVSPAAYAILQYTYFGPPTIAIRHTGTNIVLSWPTNASGIVLEYGTNLSNKTWTTNTASTYVVNGQYTITNAISKGVRFYRLKKP
jgi:hypothetical protein